MTKIRAAITGVGAYLPEYVLTNEELSKMVETSDEWITQRTGIKERRILKGPYGSAYMGIKAVQDLLQKTNTDPKTIDLIITATVTPEFIFPATANIIAAEIGATNAWGFDVEAACSSLIYSLYTAAQFIEAGTLKKIIVVGVDKMSSIINYQDRTTCILFGDAGSALLLEPNTEGYGIIDAVMYSDGNGCKHLHQKAGGSRLTPSINTVRNNLHYVYQEGREVFKHAVKGMADVSAEIMQRNNLKPEDIAFLVPHQANKRIIDATARRMGISDDKVIVNIHKYGNTTSATIPLCLYDKEKELKKGDNLVLAAFGGGFTWGAIYLKWAYDTP